MTSGVVLVLGVTVDAALYWVARFGPWEALRRPAIAAAIVLSFVQAGLLVSAGWPPPVAVSYSALGAMLVLDAGEHARAGGWHSEWLGLWGTLGVLALGAVVIVLERAHVRW